MANGKRFDPTNPVDLISRVLFGTSIDPVGKGLEAGKALGKGVAERPEQIGGAIQSISDKGLLGFLSGQAGQTGSTAQAAQPAEEQLDVVSKAIQDEQIKIAKERTRMLSDSGVPTDQLPLVSDQMRQRPDQQGQPAIGQQPVPQAPGQQGNFIQDILKFLVDPGQTQPGQPFRAPSSLGGLIQLPADERLKLQELAGATPLQSKDILTAQATSGTAQAKITAEDLKTQNRRFEELSKPLTTAKELNLVERSLTAFDTINNLLGISIDEATGQVNIENIGELRNTNFLSKNRQALRRARDVFINTQLRRESGAAIGEEEEKRFKKQEGFEIGMKAFMQNPEVIARALVISKDQLLRDRGRLSPNSEARQFNQFLSSKGIPTGQRQRILSEAGFLN